LSVTVPVDVVPPTTDVGASEIPTSTGALIVNNTGSDTAPRVAVIVTDSEAGTPFVLIVTVADVAPDGIVTED
jgi:hypothetical protein